MLNATKLIAAPFIFCLAVASCFADGMWRQLIDHPEAWPETSSTGMFTFAMITGVKSGWLDEEIYGPAARKAWLALAGYIDQNADIRYRRVSG